MRLLAFLVLGLVCVASVSGAEGAALSGREDRAAVDALTGAYDFGVAEAPPRGCVVTLKGPSAQTKRRAGMPVAINARCRHRYPILRSVSRWEPTGGGSVRLLGDKPLRELSDFSPVQDGSGVYLRGGFEGEAKVYELRARGQ